MNKILLVILIFVFSSSKIYSQEQQAEAPLNPEFIKWKDNNLKSGLSTGEIPIPILPNHDWLIAQTQKKAYAFDAVYDLRTLGLVTVAKDQGSCGSCWTFGSMGSLESAMIKQNFGTYDFSEQSMRTCHGYIMGEDMACSGGNSRKATAYLTRGYGPLLENSAPYNTDNNAACTLTSSPQFIIDKVNYYPNDASVLKQAIINYGALYTNMYFDNGSYYSSTNYYYYNGDLSTNHAVLLVGWDDNKSTNAGTGAWIIKNSWGEAWGENGFFYIAYQDTKINTSPATFHGIKSKNKGDIIHMYDELGWISSIGYYNDYGQGLVKFTTAEAQTLTSIGTYATASGAVIKANVYRNKSGNILSDLLGSTESTFCTYSGYHNIELIEPITLEANKDFYVEVQYTTRFYDFPIPFEKALDGYAAPYIKNNVGWTKGTGINWDPVGSDIAGKERDLSIRAYARSSTTSSNEVTNDDKTIEIFPQPARNQLNIKFNSDYLNQNMLIISLSGQLIAKQMITNTVETMNLSNFGSGIYLLRIENAKGNLLAQKRFIKTD